MRTTALPLFALGAGAFAANAAAPTMSARRDAAISKAKAVAAELRDKSKSNSKELETLDEGMLPHGTGGVSYAATGSGAQETCSRGQQEVSGPSSISGYQQCGVALMRMYYDDQGMLCYEQTPSLVLGPGSECLSGTTITEATCQQLLLASGGNMLQLPNGVSCPVVNSDGEKLELLPFSSGAPANGKEERQAEAQAGQVGVSSPLSSSAEQQVQPQEDASNRSAPQEQGQSTGSSSSSCTFAAPVISSPYVRCDQQQVQQEMASSMAEPSTSSFYPGDWSGQLWDQRWPSEVGVEQGNCYSGFYYPAHAVVWSPVEAGANDVHLGGCAPYYYPGSPTTTTAESGGAAPSPYNSGPMMQMQLPVGFFPGERREGATMMNPLCASWVNENGIVPPEEEDTTAATATASSSTGPAPSSTAANNTPSELQDGGVPPPPPPHPSQDTREQRKANKNRGPRMPMIPLHGWSFLTGTCASLHNSKDHQSGECNAACPFMGACVFRESCTFCHQCLPNLDQERHEPVPRQLVSIGSCSDGSCKKFCVYQDCDLGKKCDKCHVCVPSLTTHTWLALSQEGRQRRREDFDTWENSSPQERSVWSRSARDHYYGKNEEAATSYTEKAYRDAKRDARYNGKKGHLKHVPDGQDGRRHGGKKSSEVEKKPFIAKGTGRNHIDNKVAEVAVKKIVEDTGIEESQDHVIKVGKSFLSGAASSSSTSSPKPTLKADSTSPIVISKTSSSGSVSTMVSTLPVSGDGDSDQISDAAATTSTGDVIVPDQVAQTSNGREKILTSQEFPELSAAEVKTGSKASKRANMPSASKKKAKQAPRNVWG
ncbi:unnamed protein product [Amoebophrya sp. A25]|nr:unnamed protein product [Amoebophrya sp. A25]|eukprot:GSA25T00006751001.1